MIEIPRRCSFIFVIATLSLGGCNPPTATSDDGGSGGVGGSGGSGGSGDDNGGGDAMGNPDGDDNGAPTFALRFDAGLLTGTATHGGRDFLPLMPEVQNDASDCDSCNPGNDYCGQDSVEITNTTYDALYRGQIWSCGASLDLAVEVPNGTYDIHLHNAETTASAGVVGGRLATVRAEGAPVITDWDIYSEAGEQLNRATRRTVSVTVSDGELNLELVNTLGCAKICGIEVLSPDLGPLPLEEEPVAECDGDEDCTTDFAGSDYCYDGDVYHDWHDFACVSGTCIDTVERQLSEDCAALSCSGGQCSSTSIDDFDIVFSQNFNDDPLGDYLRDTWAEDWGLSAGVWSDPCYSDCEDPTAWAGARLTIHEESSGDRFMRHELTTKGTSPGTSGASWWKEIGTHDELYLSFRLRFAGDDWDGPVFDGKLPGFCGSAGCPGGGNYPTDYDEGFTTRYMFKGTNALFFYLYYMGMDLSDGPYGDGLYLEPYDVQPGEWHTVTQRVVMNTPGQTNGIVEGFLDGVLVAQKTDMDYRNATSQTISTLYFANFLGGSGAEPTDTGDTPDLDFDDFVIYTYAAGVTGIPRGTEASDPGRVIEIPQP